MSICKLTNKCYGINVESHLRQCVIVGSTNTENGFLRDITGNRSFWPVRVNGQSVKKPWQITADEVAQIWAEAVSAYQDGEKLYHEGDAAVMAVSEQVEAMKTDDREGLVRTYRDTLLPENWDSMSLYDRRNFLNGSEFGSVKNIGTVTRTTVCNMEIWCECSAGILLQENVEWLIGRCRWDFDMVVIDELSSFKSHKAKRFKALKKVRPAVERIVGLTGTPAPNGLVDLWAEIGILDMGQRLGRFIGGYRERFFLPDKRGREMIYSYKPRDGAEEAIYQLLSDICISMIATDYLEMPECIYNRMEVSMSNKEMSLYRKLEKDMLLPYEDGDIDAGNAAGLSNKLMQMANGAVYDEYGDVKQIHGRKLEALVDLVEAANGKSVLIAYWYKHGKARIKQRLGAVELDTAEDMQKWNTGEIPVAVIHPASAGHGLNLQAGGSTPIWFGLTWSLELYQQMNARLWRRDRKKQ